MRTSILLLLGLLVACGPAPEEKDSGAAPAGGAAAVKVGELDRSRAGKPAPGTVIEGPGGLPDTLAAFRGKPLLLNLWATWCPPCVAEMPTLDALAVREGSKLQVLPVSEDIGRAEVDAWLAGRDFKALGAWMDRDMELMQALGVSTLPTTILFDAQGREVWRLAGAEDWSGMRAAALIAEAGGRR
jgi:thiol-disulfide isomerase/thioredoxin